MRQTKWLVHRHTVAVVTLIASATVGMLWAREASSESMVSDGVPSGMVAFVGGGVCPPGWVHVSDLEGRAIVGTITKEDVGIGVGTPLTDREDRVHHHDYTVEVPITSKGIGSPNGVNLSGAASATYSILGQTEENNGELPFFQMEGCIKP